MESRKERFFQSPESTPKYTTYYDTKREEVVAFSHEGQERVFIRHSKTGTSTAFVKITKHSEDVTSTTYQKVADRLSVIRQLIFFKLYTKLGINQHSVYISWIDRETALSILKNHTDYITLKDAARCLINSLIKKIRHHLYLKSEIASKSIIGKLLKSLHNNLLRSCDLLDEDNLNEVINYLITQTLENFIFRRLTELENDEDKFLSHETKQANIAIFNNLKTELVDLFSAPFIQNIINEAKKETRKEELKFEFVKWETNDLFLLSSEIELTTSAKAIVKDILENQSLPSCLKKGEDAFKTKGLGNVLASANFSGNTDPIGGEGLNTYFKEDIQNECLHAYLIDADILLADASPVQKNIPYAALDTTYIDYDKLPENFKIEFIVTWVRLFNVNMRQHIKEVYELFLKDTKSENYQFPLSSKEYQELEDEIVSYTQKRKEQFMDAYACEVLKYKNQIEEAGFTLPTILSPNMLGLSAIRVMI